jgi:HTH-like domain
VLGRVLDVAPSCYTWLKQSRSNRAQEDARLLRLIRASFVASQSIYGAPRVFLDLREAGETCNKHRVAPLMREHRLHALHGYRTRRWSVALPDALQDQEKDMIEAALAKGKGRVAGATRRSRQTWYSTVDVGVEHQTVKARKEPVYVSLVIL